VFLVLVPAAHTVSVASDKLGVISRFARPASIMRYMTTSITIPNVPDKVRDVLAARAAASGRSLEEYLLAKLIGWASNSDAETVLARIAERKERTGTQLPAAEILAARCRQRLSSLPAQQKAQGAASVPG
jgi:antitoxin FitA